MTSPLKTHDDRYCSNDSFATVLLESPTTTCFWFLCPRCDLTLQQKMEWNNKKWSEKNSFFFLASLNGCEISR
jgi:hypothetical protein